VTPPGSVLTVSEAPDTERELLLRARGGDAGAFSELAALHTEALVRVAFHVLGNEPDALDATQEALLRGYRHLATFDGRASFLTWLRKITLRCSLDRIERRKRERTLRRELPEDDRLPSRESGADEVGRAEERALVRRAIEELPPAQRAAVLLRDVEGLSYEEIADALSIPKGTVMSRIYYGREALKARLARVLGEPGGRARP
jgi:RNA polymerase sigma-70 factor (ECF subfamily)